LSGGGWSLAATTLGDYALFGGGAAYDTYCTDVVTMYNTALTRSTGPSLIVGRCRLAATTVNNYALFAGGSKDRYGDGTSYERTAIVDAYTFD
jgi:hypothetical protein